MDAIRLMGLWKEKDKNGNTYLSGKLNEITSILVMPNTFKKASKDPDYFLYIRPNKESRAGRNRKTGRPLRMVEEVAIENREQAQVLANFLWNERERHKDDIG